MGIPETSATDSNRPLAADLAVLPVSMLVMFNRFHTADKLQEALNRKPGQFSKSCPPSAASTRSACSSRRSSF